MCVDPGLKRLGYAKKLLDSVCEMSARLNKKAYRFDALASNSPALSLYDSMGFKRIAERNWYASNIGWANFILFEKLL